MREERKRKKGRRIEGEGEEDDNRYIMKALISRRIKLLL